MTRIPALALNTNEFVTMLQDRLQIAGVSISKDVTRDVYKAFIDCLLDATIHGRHIKLKNFGIFYPVIRAPKKGRNPRTGAIVEIPEKRNVAFRLSTIAYEKLQQTDLEWGAICEQIFAAADDDDWENINAVP